MNFLSPRNNVVPPRTDATLTDKLLWLLSFGRPRVAHLSEGWVASIEMNTAWGACADLTIRSDFNIKHPDLAVDMLIERVMNVVGSTKPPLEHSQ